ncbi:MAG: hypothetical protein Q8M31_07610 [Beijerinckiaceae bacterium]|nr:hypothetical protein [Beijerinckiaceae bacterium]
MIKTADNEARRLMGGLYNWTHALAASPRAVIERHFPLFIFGVLALAAAGVSFAAKVF